MRSPGIARYLWRYYRVGRRKQRRARQLQESPQPLTELVTRPPVLVFACLSEGALEIAEVRLQVVGSPNSFWKGVFL